MTPFEGAAPLALASAAAAAAMLGILQRGQALRTGRRAPLRRVLVDMLTDPERLMHPFRAGDGLGGWDVGHLALVIVAVPTAMGFGAAAVTAFEAALLVHYLARTDERRAKMRPVGDP